MMVLVNSRTSPATADGTPLCEVATLPLGTLQFRGPSAGTTTTETEKEQHEQHLKDSFVRGETRETEA